MFRSTHNYRILLHPRKGAEDLFDQLGIGFLDTSCGGLAQIRVIDEIANRNIRNYHIKHGLTQGVTGQARNLVNDAVAFGAEPTAYSPQQQIRLLRHALRLDPKETFNAEGRTKPLYL